MNISHRPRSTRERRPNGLDGRLSMFEEKIRKNAERGNSSLPSHYHSIYFGKEGRRNFKISDRNSSEHPVFKPSTVQDLTKELEAVIAQLKKAEAQHKEISKNISQLPHISLRSCRQQLSTITEESAVKDREHWLPISAPLELDQSDVNDGTSDYEDSSFTSNPPPILEVETSDKENEASNPDITDEQDESRRRTQASKLLQKLVREFLTRRRLIITPPPLSAQPPPLLKSTKAHELRTEIEAMQRKLDMLSEETLSKISELQKSYDEKKTDLLKAKQEITEARQKVKIAEEKSSETLRRQKALNNIKNATENLRSSNVEYRATMIQLAREMKSLRKEQERLESENNAIDHQFQILNPFARKFEVENRKLLSAEQACRDKYKPLWRVAILESRMSGASEHRQNRKYRNTIYQILSRVNEWTLQHERKLGRNQSTRDESLALLLELQRIAEELMRGQGHHRMGPWESSSYGSSQKDDIDSVFTKSTEQDSYADSDDSSSSFSDDDDDSWDSFVDDGIYGHYYDTPSQMWGEETDPSLYNNDLDEGNEVCRNVHQSCKTDL